MKSPKARQFGARGVLAVAAAMWLLLAGIALVSPALAILTLTAIVALIAVLSHRRLAALATSHEKLSSEIDIISQHVLKIQALAQAAAERVRTLVPAPGTEPSHVDRVAEGVTRELAANIEEATTEIGLLGAMVRELATVVSTQETELGALKAGLEASGRRLSDVETLARTARTEPANRPEPSPPNPRPVQLVPAAPVPRMPANDPDRERTLVEAFDADGLEVWLQPLVTLPQRKVVSYEALARMRLVGQDGDETILTPDAFMPTLERHGRTTALDRRMLTGVATIARHLQGRGSIATVGYALSPLSLYEPDFLRSLGTLVGEEADLSGKLLVSLPQASWRSLDREQQTTLAELSGRIGFILDRPVDLRFEPRLLAERGISLVKVPGASLLRPTDLGGASDLAIEDLAAMLARAGVSLVASEVDREADVPDLIDLDVPLAQGDVFATPRAVRAEVFGTRAAPAVEPEPPDPEPEPPPRRAFRDFLRRAV